MSNLSLTRLTASGSPTGLVRLRCWVEQQNAEYNRESGSVEDGPLRLGSDNLLGFEQRDGGFPHDVVADLQSLFPDLTFAGYAWSETGWSCHIEIRYGYTRVRFEDEDDWDNDLGRPIISLISKTMSTLNSRRARRRPRNHCRPISSSG
jgi:hypothetical protein